MNNFMTRKYGLLGLAMAAVLVTAGCGQNSDAPSEPAGEISLDSLEQQVTYIVGYNMAQQAQDNGLEFQQDVMTAAIQDVKEGKEPRIPQGEQQSIMMAFQEQQQSERDAEIEAAAGGNLEESLAFLAENAEKEGVQVTESGLQYKILEEGEEGAPSPGPEDTVKVHYHGTLIDGTVFDSSVDRGEPVSFPVQGVIPGWIEALQLMSVGDKFELYVPPELAYGERGTSGKIGPNAALIFEVELLEVNPDVSGHHGH